MSESEFLGVQGYKLLLLGQNDRGVGGKGLSLGFLGE